MKKLLAFLLLATMLIGCITGCSSNQEESGDEPIRIGLIAPITDDYGVYIQQACEYATEVVNQNGGVLGRPVELVVEDETLEQQGSINAMMKLYNRKDLTVVLGSSGNSNCLAVIDIAADYKTPTIMNGGNITYDQHKNPWVWQTRMSDADKGKIYADIITQTMGTKNLAVLHQTDAAGGPRERMLTALKENYDMEPIVSLTYDQNTETDYSKYIMQIQQTDADGLFVIAELVAAPLIMKAVKDLGLNVPCVGPATLSMDSVIENAGDAANGWYSMTEWTNTLTEENKAAFIKGYTEYAGREPSWAAAVYYDSLMLACEAIEMAGSTDAEAVNKAFEEIENFDGVISTLSYHENHTFADSIYVVQVQDGKAVVVENAQP